MHTSTSTVRGEGTAANVDRFMIEVDRVRAAHTVLAAVERHRGAAHQQIAADARRTIDAGKDRVFEITITCMLCRAPVAFTITVADYAGLLAAPRAICGKH